jgi:hypothetical protein
MESVHRFKRSTHKIDFIWNDYDWGDWIAVFGHVHRLYFRQDLIPILYRLLPLQSLFRLHRLGVGFPCVLSLPIILTILLGSINVSFASSYFFTRVIESALIKGTLYQRHSYKRNKERLIYYCNPSNMKTAIFGRYSARRSNNTKMSA